MRILVVEDDTRFGELLRRALVSEGYAVDLAADGEEASRLSEMAPYSLAIVDVMLPKADGFSVCKRIRSFEKPFPVIMLTARDALEDKITGLDLGADDYLTKPVAFPELFARMRVLMRRQDARRDPLIQVGQVSLDTTRRRVVAAGQEVELTGKEFAILLLLMRHPERVFSREEIADHVWDFEYEPASNLIDVYMGRLRRKLGEVGGHLVTLRGQGYSIRP